MLTLLLFLKINDTRKDISATKQDIQIRQRPACPVGHVDYKFRALVPTHLKRIYNILKRIANAIETFCQRT